MTHAVRIIAALAIAAASVLTTGTAYVVGTHHPITTPVVQASTHADDYRTTTTTTTTTTLAPTCTTTTTPTTVTATCTVGTATATHTTTIPTPVVQAPARTTTPVVHHHHTPTTTPVARTTTPTPAVVTPTPVVQAPAVVTPTPTPVVLVLESGDVTPAGEAAGVVEYTTLEDGSSIPTTDAPAYFGETTPDAPASDYDPATDYDRNGDGVTTDEEAEGASALEILEAAATTTPAE